MPKALSEAQVANLSDEQRRRWAESDDDAFELETTDDSQSQEAEEATEETGGDGQGDPEDTGETTEAEQETEQETTQKDWKPEGPGDLKKALSEARNDLKQVKEERDSIRTQADTRIAELSGQISNLTTLVQGLMQAGLSRKEATEQAQEIIENQSDPEPDIEEDPGAWAKWVREQAKKEALSEVDSLRKEIMTERQQRHVQNVQAAEAAFAGDNKDYFQLVNMKDPNNLLTAYYKQNPSVYEAHMKASEPWKEAYSFSKALHIMAGKLPQQEQPQAKPKTQQTASKTVSNQKTPPTLAGVPSTRDRVDEATPADASEEEIAAMTPRQREKYLKGI